MEHELLSLLKSLQFLDKITLEIVTGPENNTTVGINQLDLHQYASQQLKKILGQKQYYELLNSIKSIKEVYNIPPLTLRLSIPEPSPATLQIPVLSVSTLYDTATQRSILRVSQTRQSEYAKFLEIAYAYDRNNAPGDWTYTYVSCVTNTAQLDIVVLPNTKVWVRQRWIGTAEHSDWTIPTWVLTQRDELQPAPPVVRDILRGFKTITIVFDQPSEKDFWKFIIWFVMNANTYVFETATTICTIDLAGQIADNNYQDSTITLYAKQVDTSLNESNTISFDVNIRQFIDIEPNLASIIDNQYNLQIYLNGIVERLNQTVSYNDVIAEIDENKIVVTNIEVNENFIGLQAIITHNGTLKLYKIVDVDTENNQLILSEPPVQNVLDPVYITGILEATRIFQQQTAEGLETTVQRLINSQHVVIAGQIAPPVVLEQNRLSDPNKDFSQVSQGCVLVLLDQNGKLVQSARIDSVDATTQTVYFAKNFSQEQFNQQQQYYIFSPMQFTGSIIGQYYDKITAQVESVYFKPLLTSSVQSIDYETGEIQLQDHLPVDCHPNTIKLFDGQIVKFYDVLQYSDTTVYVEPDETLPLFMLPTTRQEVFEMSDILRSNLILQQNDISSSVFNLASNVYTKIQQTADMIQIKVVNNQLVSSYFEMSNDKIVLQQQHVIVDGDAIVTGQIDQSKVSIKSGLTTLDGDGIKIRTGDIKLGQYDTNSYRVQINNDGSGHVQSGKISWTTNGSVNIDASSGSVTVNVNSFQIKNGSNTQSFVMDGSQFVFDQTNVKINGNQVVSGTLRLEQFAESDLNKLKYRVLVSPNSHTIIRSRIYGSFYSVYPQTVSSQIKVIDITTNTERSVNSVIVSGPSSTQLSTEYDQQTQTLYWYNLNRIQSTEVWTISLPEFDTSFQIALNVVSYELGTIELRLYPQKVFNTIIIDGEQGLQYVNAGGNYIDITPVPSSPLLLQSLQGTISEQWLIKLDNSDFIAAPVEFITSDVPRTARLYWDSIKEYGQIVIKYSLIHDGEVAYETTVDILNICNYRLDVPLRVKLVQDNTVLSSSQTEAIVTAMIYKNGRLVTEEELSDYIITFEPEGALVYENGVVVPNKRKYTVIDVFKQLNIKCTVKSRFTR